MRPIAAVAGEGLMRIRVAVEDDDPGFRRQPGCREAVEGVRGYAVAFEAHYPLGGAPGLVRTERLGEVALVHHRPVLRERLVPLRHAAMDGPGKGAPGGCRNPVAVATRLARTNPRMRTRERVEERQTGHFA